LNKMTYHVMTAPDGKQYEWKSNITPELFPLKSEEVSEEGKPERKPLAIYKHANYVTRKRPILLVDESVLDILDQIVASFIVVEVARMDRAY